MTLKIDLADSDRLKVIVLNGSYIVSEQNEKKEWIDKVIKEAPKNIKAGIYRLREAKPAGDKIYDGVVVFTDNKVAITAQKGKLITHSNKEMNLKLGQNVKIDYSKSKDSPVVTLGKSVIHKSRSR